MNTYNICITATLTDSEDRLTAIVSVNAETPRAAIEAATDYSENDIDWYNLTKHQDHNAPIQATDIHRLSYEVMA